MQKENKTKIITLCMLLFIFCSMYLLNHFTPLIADDFSYALTTDKNHRIQSLMDIINYQANYYMNWGGRNIAHTIAQLFLMHSKSLFNIFNSFMYTAMVYLIYKIAKGKNKEQPLYLLLIHLGLYFTLPAFGQTNLWLVGSCNYLWTITIILLLIYLFLNKKYEDKVSTIILFLLLGIIAGWSNENTSFGLFVILITTLIIKKIKNQKIYKWQISSSIGNLLGFLIMILAPGNFARSEEFVDTNPFLIKIFNRFIDYSDKMYEYCFLLLIIIIVLISIYLYKKKKIESIAYSFLGGAFFAIYSMLLSPTFPPRAWTGVIIFLILAISNLAYNLVEKERLLKVIIMDSIIILSIVYIKDYYYLVQDVRYLKYCWNERIKVMENNKGQSVELDKLYITHKRNPNTGIADIQEESDVWPNQQVATYYDVKEVTRQK